jgi:hypothetical protein
VTLLDQKQRHDIGRVRHGNMAALSKLAEPVIKNVADFIKSFSDKTYYHFSPRPDIEKFDPKADPSFEDASGFGGRGVTYFTSDPEYANRIGSDILLDTEGLGPEKSGMAAFKDAPLDEFYEENIEGATIYPVKIKDKNIFDYKNKKQVSNLLKDLTEKNLGYEAYSDTFRKGFLSEEETIDLIKSGNWEVLESQGVSKTLKDQGFSGYMTNEPGTVGLFYPGEGDVRSIFAKFDPAKSKSGDILASVPAATLTGYGALEALNGQSSD